MIKNFKIKPREISSKLTNFISKTVRNEGFSKAILGLSGGLDSTVVAYLSKEALGSSNVVCVIMPYGKMSVQAVKDANIIAKILKVKTEYIDIAPMVDAYFKAVKDADDIRRGNKMARERMAVLYDLSKKHKALVIGTSNRTERLLGYGTIYGDTACALNPIAGLYKTQLIELARFLKVPSFIIKKSPSADLWQGQTDEGELGYRYLDIDRLLFFMIDKRLNVKQLLRKGFSEKFISDIKGRIHNNSFKLRPPILARG